MDRVEELRLVRQAKEGDADALVRLLDEYDRYFRSVANHWLRKVGLFRPGLDEDAVAEARAVAWSAINAFDPGKEVRFYCWVAGIVERRVKAWGKKNRRKPAVVYQPFTLEEIAEQEENGEQTDRRNSYQKLRRHVARLPRPMRRVVIRKHFWKQGYGQIAAKEGCSEDVARARLSRAHKKLASKLVGPKGAPPRSDKGSASFIPWQATRGGRSLQSFGVF